MNCFYKLHHRYSWRQKGPLLLDLRVGDVYYSTGPSLASILGKIRDKKPLYQLHAQIIVSNVSENVVICNKLMNAYASCGIVSTAQIVFSQISKKNLFSWTILLSGLTKNGRFSEAVEVFYEMMVSEIRPNEITIASVLPALGKLGYSYNGYGDEALQMFNWMKREGMSGDIFTIMSLISLEDLRVGIGIHGLIVKRGYENDQLLKTALMGMYINGDVVNDAHRIFEKIDQKGLVAWTVMLRGLSKSDDWRRTIEHFNEMMGEDEIELDSVSLITMLSGCSSSGALQQGRRIHALLIKTGFEDDVFVGSSVIDMYGNCASMKDAKRYFDLMNEKDIACWNALISGYGMIGRGREAIDTFLKMKYSGLSPNESTLVSVLCACSHGGLVAQGLQIFDQMTEVWNLIPNSKHYACVIDLLARSGRINDAYSLMKTMHLQPGLEIFTSLLTSCKIHKNFEMGNEISQELLHFKPNDAGYYILLSNMYALAGNWDCARITRISLKSSNLKKNPGLSSIEVNGEMFTFMASQKDHPYYLEIKEFLEGLILKINTAGYVPDMNSVPLNVSDDVKQDILFHHSEKLAIAFGLMRNKRGTVVRITKNLRICDDCHLASKFISKVYARILVIKDAHRFHVFRDGICSCGDWW